MSKVNFVITASNDTLNEKTGTILMAVYATNFMDSAAIREKVKAKLENVSDASINSNIGVLVKSGLIEKSENTFIITESGSEIIEKALELFSAENPDLSKPRGQRKREVTQEMYTEQDWMIDAVEARWGLNKDPIEYRSNILIEPANRKMGIRTFEIKNKVSEYRITYSKKLSKELLDELIALGMTNKEKAKGAGGYLDMTYTHANIVATMEAIEKYFPNETNDESDAPQENEQ